MSKFYNTIPEEQETNVYIDHSKKKAKCYTSRYAVYNRLIKKLGEPTRVYKTDKKISGAMWEVPFSDKKRVKVLLSMTMIIGQC